MRRRLFTLASALSLLLCMAACAMWVRSYSVEDYYQRNARQDGSDGTVIDIDSIYASHGELGWMHVKLQYGHGPWLAAWLTPDRTWDGLQRRGSGEWPSGPGVEASMSFAHKVAGFHFHHAVSHIPNTSCVHEARMVIVPYWFLFAALALLPILWSRAEIRTRRANRRKRLGCCSACGYDLRASPERCPECGVVPAI